MRFIVGKSWDLKLQIHLLEKGCAQLAGVIAHIISLMLDLYLEDAGADRGRAGAEPRQKLEKYWRQYQRVTVEKI